MADKKITELTSYTSPIDTDLVAGVDVTAGETKKFTWAGIKATLKTYFDGLYFTITNALGKKNYHGIEASGTLSFNNSSHIFSIASGTNTYWYKGTKYTTASAITCDLDDTYTITTDTIYYFYFDDASGTLKVSTGAWDLKEKVPVASVFWNGSAGAICKETHGHMRDLDWHIWGHLTVGARISPADFALTAPNSGSPTTVAVAGGTLYDEDLLSTFTAKSNARVWYQTGATTYRWVDSNSIYPTNVRFSDSANSYTLTDVASNDYINVWVYISPDIDRPVYCFTETKATSGYATIALARNATPPNFSNFGLNQEIKLIYRIIMKGDESWVETTDYRATASLPVGGITAPTASAVTFAPTGTVSASNVQTAIEELDAEKVPATRSITINGIAQDLSTDRSWTVSASTTLAFDLDANGDYQPAVATPVSDMFEEVAGELTPSDFYYDETDEITFATSVSSAVRICGLEFDVYGDFQPITGTPVSDYFEVDTNGDLQPKDFDWFNFNDESQDIVIQTGNTGVSLDFYFT